MKKLYFTLLAGIATLSASALINGDGYYRIQNCKTERYIYVMDNKGKLNFQATNAELGAIELWKNYEKTISDPATIIYVTDLTGNKRDYDLQAQGTGVNEIISYPVSIRLDTKYFADSYMIFGRNSSVTRYIGDGTKFASDQGYVASLDNNEYYRWYFHPVTTDDSNYFGITSEFSQDNVNYSTFFADFPFEFHSEGMKAYKVHCVKKDQVHLEEVTGIIPRSTPLVITSASPVASGSRLKIGGTPTAQVGDNLLKGVFFNNTVSLHVNQTPYDPKTMRVLGVLSDGTIGFKVGNMQYLPRNKAYLVVPEDAPAELHLTYEEPEDVNGLVDALEMSTAVITVEGHTLYVSGVANAEVFTMSGTMVGEIANAENGASITLPTTGVYIVKYGNHATKVTVK